MKAGYSSKTARCASNIEDGILEKSFEVGLVNEVKSAFSTRRLISKLDELLEAHRIIRIGNAEISSPDHAVQYKTIELILKLRGDLSESQKSTGSDTPVMINITYSESGSEEK